MTIVVTSTLTVAKTLVNINTTLLKYLNRFVYLCMMTRDVHIKELFPSTYFGMLNMACLDIDNDRDLIIPRALMATTH